MENNQSLELAGLGLGRNINSPIAFFLPDLRGAGAERVMLYLACSLADLGYAVHLVLVTARGDYMDDVPGNVKLVDLGAKQTIASLPSLVRYLKREQPRMLLSALEHTSVLSLWAKRLACVTTRIVVCVHNNLSTDYQISRSPRKRLELRMIRLFYRHADQIIAVSRGAADDLAALVGLPRDRIDVIYNPVVSDDLLQRSKQAVDHPWFNRGEPPVVLSAGRLTAQKDQATLIRAFARLRASLPARLMILGEGEERASLEKLARELGVETDVMLPGFVDNPFAYMNKAAVFALSSRYEGLPTVLIEALASGAQVISTDCPSGPNEILNCGEFGLLVSAGDVEALADALKSVLSRQKVAPAAESWLPYVKSVAVENYRSKLGLNSPHPFEPI